LQDNNFKPISHLSATDTTICQNVDYFFFTNLIVN